MSLDNIYNTLRTKIRARLGSTNNTDGVYSTYITEILCSQKRSIFVRKKSTEQDAVADKDEDIDYGRSLLKRK